MRSGLAELARLRRQGVKSVKHAPMEREVRCRAGASLSAFFPSAVDCRRSSVPSQTVGRSPTLRASSSLASQWVPCLRSAAQVYISLEKLNSGCTKTVAVERRRVAPDGREFASTKNIHLVLR